MPQKSAKKAEPVKAAPCRYDLITVRDCLVWNEKKKKTNKAAREPEAKVTYVLPKKGGIGQRNTRLFDLPGEQHWYGVPVVDNGDHVVNALHGWPREPEVVEETGDDEYYDILKCKTPIEREAEERAATSKRRRRRPSKDPVEAGAYRRKKSLTITTAAPFMVDLVSHKFMLEAERARLYAQHVREAKLAAEKRERLKQLNPKAIKLTRAQMLRNLANAEKPVEYSPLLLWQMPKFKDNARPTIDSHRGTATSVDYADASGLNNCACAPTSEEIELPVPIDDGRLQSGDGI